MVFIGSDHGGYDLKEKIKLWLTEWNIPFKDVGPYTLDPNDDYPDYAHKVTEKVVEDLEINKGILVCRSGSGMVIAANKVKNVRAALIFDEKSAKHARSNDDVNIASVAGDWVDESSAKKAVKEFLETPFSGEERHKRRIEKLEPKT
jgi:ribose 5-phosphate isomerase B